MLALNMIARNEAPRIGRAIDAARRAGCTEFVIVDTGSTDGTIDAIRAHGIEPLRFAWCDDFAAARNAALDATTGDWVLVLDADDDITDADAFALRHVATQLTDAHDLVVAPYRYAWDGDACIYTHPINRLIRRTSGRRWIGRVHEQFDTDGASVAHTARFAVDHRCEGKARPEGFQRRLLERQRAEGDTSPRTAFLLANALYQADECDGARTLYADVLAHPDASELERIDAARALFYDAAHRGDTDAARAHADALRMIAPDLPDGHAFAGLLALDAGDPSALWHLKAAADRAAVTEPRSRWTLGTMMTRELYTRTIPDALASAAATAHPAVA